MRWDFVEGKGVRTRLVERVLDPVDSLILTIIYKRRVLREVIFIMSGKGGVLARFGGGCYSWFAEWRRSGHSGETESLGLGMAFGGP